MNKSKLQIIKDLWLGENVNAPKEEFPSEAQAPLSKEEKRAFVESMRNYSQMGESIYSKGSLQELCERMKDMVDKAERIVTENADWFDKTMHEKSFRRLREDYKMFEEAAKEMSKSQQRLEMAYENMGQAFSKYYDVQ